MTEFWTYIDDGAWKDCEFESRDEAINEATEWLVHENDGLKNGQIVRKEIKIIRYRYDDETFEPIVVSEEDFEIEYEHYHGDFAEHCSWGR